MDPDAIRAILVALAECAGWLGRPPPFVPATAHQPRSGDRSLSRHPDAAIAEGCSLVL